MALWQAWNELNTIIARDGVPYDYQGYKSSVDEEYFRKVKDDCAAALEELHGESINPWPPRFRG